MISVGMFSLLLKLGAALAKTSCAPIATLIDRFTAFKVLLSEESTPKILITSAQCMQADKANDIATGSKN